MGEGGEVLKPGPLDLEHQHPDIPVAVPLRNAHAGVLVYDMTLPEPYRGEMWTPFRDRMPRAAKCYRLASGSMVHVRPGCRCPR